MKKKTKEELQSSRDFVRGYICAVCCLINSHGDSTEVRDILGGIGINSLNTSWIDDEDYYTLVKHGYLKD
jgi:hypothetical protein